VSGEVIRRTLHKNGNLDDHSSVPFPNMDYSPKDFVPYIGFPKMLWTPEWEMVT
jgi:hypothetical protein